MKTISDIFFKLVPKFRKVVNCVSVLFLALFVVGCAISATAQNSQIPVPQSPQTGSSIPQELQTKRILGIMPNFRAVGSDVKLPPQTVKDKFITTVEDSFDYSSVFIPAMLAGYSMGTNATPEFGHGAEGYAQYFWHAGVDQTTENFLVEFVVPVIARQDTRFYTLGHGGMLRRTGYALTRAVVTRSDSGKKEFNFSEVLGAGASASLSPLYYPSSQSDFSSIGKQWGLDLGIDGLSFVAKEFWPDINRHLMHAHPESRPAFRTQ